MKIESCDLCAVPVTSLPNTFCVICSRHTLQGTFPATCRNYLDMQVNLVTMAVASHLILLIAVVAQISPLL